MELLAIHDYWGYGVYWALVETLRIANDYRIDSRLVNGLARSLGAPVEQLQALLATCESTGLLEREDEHFLFSRSLRRRMDAFQEKRSRRVEAGRKGGVSKALANPSNARAMLEHCQNNALAMPSLSNTNTNTNTNTTPIDPSTSLVGTDLVPEVPEPPKPTPRKVRTATEPEALPALPPEIDTDAVRCAISTWLTHKAERKEKYKPAGIAALIARLAKMTPAQIIAAIEHSTAANYAGIYEPKPMNGGRPAKQTNFEKLAEFHRREAMEAENG